MRQALKKSIETIPRRIDAHNLVEAFDTDAEQRYTVRNPDGLPTVSGSELANALKPYVFGAGVDQEFILERGRAVHRGVELISQGKRLKPDSVDPRIEPRLSAFQTYQDEFAYDYRTVLVEKSMAAELRTPTTSSRIILCATPDRLSYDPRRQAFVLEDWKMSAHWERTLLQLSFYLVVHSLLLGQRPTLLNMLSIDGHRTILQEVELGANGRPRVRAAEAKEFHRFVGAVLGFLEAVAALHGDVAMLRPRSQRLEENQDYGNDEGPYTSYGRDV